MRIEEIINLSDQDLRKLSKEPNKLREIAEIITKKAERRRLDAREYLESKGISLRGIQAPQAYRMNWNFNKPFAIPKTNGTNTLINYIHSVQSFLQAKTSTGVGAYKSMNKLIKHFEKESQVDLTYILSNKNMATRFWRIVAGVGDFITGTDYKYLSETTQQLKGYTRKLQQTVLDRITSKHNWKSQMRRKLGEMDDDIFAQEVIRELEELFEDRYREQQQLENEALERASKRSNQKTRLTKNTRF